MSEPIKKTLTLNEILENPIEELEIPGIGFVKARCPTTKDKLDAKNELKALGELDDTTKMIELGRLQALKMLVEPKITLEDYLKCNDALIFNILDTIDIWYTLKLKSYTDKRKAMIKDFLEQVKELNQ